MLQTKKCIKCNEIYPETLEFFHSDGRKSDKIKLKSVCKKCVSEKNKEIRQKFQKIKSCFLEFKKCFICKNEYKNTEEFFPSYGKRNKFTETKGLYGRCHSCHEKYVLSKNNFKLPKERACKICTNSYPLTKEYFNADSLNNFHYLCKKCYAINLKNKRLDNKNLIIKNLFTFGTFSILEQINKEKWKCQCINCKLIYEIDSYKIYNYKNLSCGCLTQEEWEIIPSFMDYRDISGTKWRSIIEGAKSRNIIFNLKIQDVWNLFEEQNRLCYYSNIPLSFIDKTASIDRKNNNKGYIIENIAIVHKDINQMKMDFEEDYFISLCACVAENLKRDQAIKHYLNNGWKKVLK